MSEQILLLNPRRRKRKGRMPAALARYWAKKRRTRAVNPRRRRRRAHARRRHVAVNPRRHYRRHHRKVYAVNRRRRSHRRHAARRYSNPRRMSARTSHLVKDLAMPAAIGGLGAVVLDISWGYASPMLPASLQTGMLASLAKVGIVVGLAMAVGKFMPGLRSKAHTAAVGAVTVQAYNFMKGLAQQTIGSSVPGLSGYIPDYQPIRLGGYMPARLGDLYSPAAVIGPPGSQPVRQFGAYQAHTAGNGGLMGFDYMNDGM
jgi:hypothetical protein